MLTCPRAIFTTAQLPASPSPAMEARASDAEPPGRELETSLEVGDVVRAHALPGQLERFNGNLATIESVGFDEKGGQWINVKLSDDVRVLPIRCTAAAVTHVTPAESNQANATGKDEDSAGGPLQVFQHAVHVITSSSSMIKHLEQGWQVVAGDQVTVSGLPMNLARYDGLSGHVISIDQDSEEPKVWVKLEDDVRELPIRCPMSCTKRIKVSLLQQPSASKQLLSDGEQLHMGKKSANNVENYADVMAHFKAEKLGPIPEEDEEEEEEGGEGEGEVGGKTEGQEGEEGVWDPTKVAMWEKKVKARRSDLILVFVFASCNCDGARLSLCRRA